MDLTTEIASGFNVRRYLELRPRLDLPATDTVAWGEVLGAFRARISERFLRPIGLLERGASTGAERTVPGFAILALDCLLIDTIQSFREGRISTGEISPAKSFKGFLESPRFACFSKDDRRGFFHYVRNGLLHNGETRGDWKVRADRTEMLSRDPKTGTRILNRKLFHEAIDAEFADYYRQLEAGPSPARERFLRRMDAICGLAQVEVQGRLYFAYGSNLVEEEILATAPGAVSEGVAYLPGHRLAFTKHSTSRGGDAASIESSPSRMLWGFLYRLPSEDEDALRRREQGYDERCVSVWRLEVAGDCESGRLVDAFTFVAKSCCPDNCGPTDNYLRLVIGGARSRGLPEDYVESIGTPASRARA